MTFQYLLIYCFTILFSANSFAQDELFEQHAIVAMRMIGDEILLSSGDSNSRVLAIEHLNNRYKIEFESEFQFNPDSMINTIHQVVIKTEIASRYLVEVEICNTNKVIYSYEKGIIEDDNFVPCRLRQQPKDCYKLFITIIDKVNPTFLQPEESSISTNMNKIYVFVFLLVGVGFVFYYSKRKIKTNPDWITIGEYQFDKKGMMLTLKKREIELSSKEVDLLFLLYTNENKTLERDHILNVVWGDEGDYVGRTLDVFISKLRKKLEFDPTLKIVNIRGIGYRFVMN